MAVAVLNCPLRLSGFRFSFVSSLMESSPQTNAGDCYIQSSDECSEFYVESRTPVHVLDCLWLEPAF